MITFKEKKKEDINIQYYFNYQKDKWVETNETHINSLWFVWIGNDNAKPQYLDKDGWIVFTTDERFKQ